MSVLDLAGCISLLRNEYQNKIRPSHTENYNLLVEIMREIFTEVLALQGTVYAPKFPLKFGSDSAQSGYNSVYLLEDGSFAVFHGGRVRPFTLKTITDDETCTVYPDIKSLHYLCNCLIWQAFYVGIPKATTYQWNNRLSQVRVICPLAE